MNTILPREAMWLRLLNVMDSIDHDCDSVENLVYFLVGIEEQYRGKFDPAIEFEEYVAVNLCSSIRRVLEGSIKK